MTHKNSVTRETLGKALPDFGIGIGITNITSALTGTAHTIYTLPRIMDLILLQKLRFNPVVLDMDLEVVVMKLFIMHN